MIIVWRRPEEPAAFRRSATRYLRAFVVILILGAVGIVVLGWSLGGWWGLAAGAGVGALVLVGGAAYDQGLDEFSQLGPHVGGVPVDILEDVTTLSAGSWGKTAARNHVRFRPSAEAPREPFDDCCWR